MVHTENTTHNRLSMIFLVNVLKGITQLIDNVDATGTVISLEMLQSIYDLNINF